MILINITDEINITRLTKKTGLTYNTNFKHIKMFIEKDYIINKQVHNEKLIYLTKIGKQKQKILIKFCEAFRCDKSR